MKTLRVIAIGFLFLSERLAANATNLEITIAPRFNHAPLVFDSLTNQTTAGQKISVTRLDFLVSDIALRRTGGHVDSRIEPIRLYQRSRRSHQFHRGESAPREF